MTSVSTHILDTTKGQPAKGVRVRLETQKGQLIGAMTTDENGRIASFGRDVEPGDYRLVFETREYDASGFFLQVSLDVKLGDGHTHIPLLLSRYGISSYRGS